MDVAVLGWGTYLMTPTKVEAWLLLYEEWDYLHYCVAFLLNPLSNPLNFPFKVVGSDPLLHFALIRLPYKWAFLLPYFLFLPSSSHLLDFLISCVPNFGIFFCSKLHLCIGLSFNQIHTISFPFVGEFFLSILLLLSFMSNHPLLITIVSVLLLHCSLQEIPVRNTYFLWMVVQPYVLVVYLHLPMRGMKMDIICRSRKNP